MSLMGHDGFGSCSQRSPGAITAGRKWNYARLPVGLLPRGSETVSEGQPPGEFCLWAIAAESRLFSFFGFHCSVCGNFSFSSFGVKREALGEGSFPLSENSADLEGMQGSSRSGNPAAERLFLLRVTSPFPDALALHSLSLSHKQGELMREGK